MSKIGHTDVKELCMSEVCNALHGNFNVPSASHGEIQHEVCRPLRRSISLFGRFGGGNANRRRARRPQCPPSPSASNERKQNALARGRRRAGARRLPSPFTLLPWAVLPLTTSARWVARLIVP